MVLHVIAEDIDSALKLLPAVVALIKAGENNYFRSYPDGSELGFYHDDVVPK